MPDTTDPNLKLFNEAVQLLGGQRAAARYLKISERSVRFVLAGERELHDGFLREIAAALVEHAEKCRAAERTLFSQAIRTAPDKPHGNRFDQKGKAPPSSSAAIGQKGTRNG